MGIASSKLYVPLSASARLDKRLRRAGPEAELLWYRLLQLAKQDEGDGVLHVSQILPEAPWPKTADKAMAALVREGLLRPVGGDGEFSMAGWLDWNDSKAVLDERRRKERDRKEEWRRTQKGQDGGVPAGQTADATRDGREDSGRKDAGGPAHRGEERRAGKAVNYSGGTSTVSPPGGFAPDDSQRNGEPQALTAESLMQSIGTGGVS